MSRRSLLRLAMALLVPACFLSLNTAPALAAENPAWTGTITFHWKAASSGDGTTQEADWTGSWTIESQLPPKASQPPSTASVVAQLTLKGTSIDTSKRACDNGNVQVHTRTTTATDTVTATLDLIWGPDKVWLDSEPYASPFRLMHGKWNDTDVACDGTVNTDELPFDFLAPQMSIQVPLSGKVANGSATIPFKPNSSDFGVDIAGQLGAAPRDSSDVVWDLSHGNLHHYVIEIRSWIPLQRIADPLHPTPYPWEKTLDGPYRTLSPDCLTVPPDEEQYTVVSATFRGDGHQGFDGSYRLAHRIEFDYDGQSITNFTVTPGFAHVGETHEDKRYTVIGMSEPHPARECTRAATAPDGSAATASGKTFQVSYRGSNPLVPSAPAIVHVIDGQLRDNGTIGIRYKVTNFPSSGLRVTRDGAEIANVLTNDVSCLTEESAQGFVGAARLGYGLITTRTGTFDIDYTNPAHQSIQSALCQGLWSP